MAAPVPLTGGTFLKATVFNKFLEQGWTESWFFQVNGGSNPYNDVATLMSSINGARTKTMPLTATLVGMRVEIVQGNVTGQAQPYFPPTFGLGPGTRGAAGTNPWGAWLFRETDQSGNIHGSRLIRAWADVDLAGYTIGGSLFGKAPPATVTTYTTQMTNFLGTSFNGPSGGTVIPCIPGFNRLSSVPAPPAPFSLIAKITSATLSAGNTLQFTVDTLDPLIVPGSVIMVKAKRQRCTRGLSGRATVLQVNPVPTVNTIVTSKNFCCSAADLAKVTGTIRIYLPAYYQYAGLAAGSTSLPTYSAIAPERVVNRKVGRTFFVTAGRRGSKCC